MPSSPKKLFLVDGSGFIFRAYHALPPFSRPDGTPVGAVLGFSNMLFKLLDNKEIEYLAVIFDTPHKTFRHDLYEAYKANRDAPPEDLVPQFRLVREACHAFNVPFFERKGFEADDLLATLCVRGASEGFHTTLVSSDKDLMQLVGDTVSMLDPLKNKTIGPEEVFEKFGVDPSKVIEVQALAGDSSDNIPGVPGIGIKTAATLIQAYGSLDHLLAKAHEIKQPKRRQSLIDHEDKARLSRELVRLKQDVPLECSLESFKRAPLEATTLFPFLEHNQFKTLKARAIKLGLTPPDTKTLPGTRTIPEEEDCQKGDCPEEASYEIIQDEETLLLWTHALQKAGLMAFDTETTSLDARTADLVGLSLAYAPGKACYIPLCHKLPPLERDLFDQVSPSSPSSSSSSATVSSTTPPPLAQETLTQLPLETVLKHLKPLFEEPGLLKIAHNAKYDLTVLSRYGLTCHSLDDTMVMSYVLDGTKNRHGLDELAQRHLGHQTISFEDVAGQGKNQVTFDFVPLEKAGPYAAEDADIALRLHQHFRRRLFAEKALTVYETLDRPLLPVLLDMELAGVKIDTAQLIALSTLFQESLSTLEEEIHTLAGHPFNVASPQQLATVLFEELQLASGKKGKSGTYSTSVEVLESLALEGHDIAEKVIAWRQFSKLKSTYTDALVRDIDPTTKRIHTSFGMTVTSTGRLSSRNPNLQNIPIRTEEGRKIRRAFIAEPSHLLVSLDYSQIELRLLAHMADIKSLRDAFKKGLDIHAQTASEVFGLPLERVDPEHRRRAKAINFGIIYGISPFGLARQLKISRTEASAYIEAYCQKYPGILSYMEVLKTQARQQGYVETLFGRKCFIDNIHSKNPALRGFAERQAINAPLQGSASDIIKRAMCLVFPALHRASLFPSLILQVHDELVFEASQETCEKVARLAQGVMESVIALKVPLKVDFGIGPSWDQAH